MFSLLIPPLPIMDAEVCVYIEAFSLLVTHLLLAELKLGNNRLFVTKCHPPVVTYRDNR